MKRCDNAVTEGGVGLLMMTVQWGPIKSFRRVYNNDVVIDIRIWNMERLDFQTHDIYE